MAYGYNDGERQRNVRLAGRTTPTSRSVSDSDGPQNPQRPQDRPSSSMLQNASARQADCPYSGARQRRAEVPRRQKNDRRKSDNHISRFFSKPRDGRSAKQPRPMGRVRAVNPRIHRLCLVLCSIVACLAFVYLGSCASHGSAGLEPAAEEKLLKAPVAPGYSFAFSTPRSQWQAGTMPHIYQIDPAWSELPYAGGTIRQNACGPTCLTMVYIYKTGHTDMTPVDMCALSEAGNYAPTGATEWSFMTSGAWQLGLNGTQLYNDRDSMAQALRSGAPVIAAVRPGTFTNVGHYIVLYGIDDADQIGVYDPNSQSRSARRWGVVEVLNEIEAMWAYY